MKGTGKERGFQAKGMVGVRKSIILFQPRLEGEFASGKEWR